MGVGGQARGELIVQPLKLSIIQHDFNDYIVLEIKLDHFSNMQLYYKTILQGFRML